MTKLTREYFETHGYKAGTYTVDGTELWCVSLRKRYEEGDHIYANVDITNPNIVNVDNRTFLWNALSKLPALNICSVYNRLNTPRPLI